jgi:hypothetical protein
LIWNATALLFGSALGLLIGFVWNRIAPTGKTRIFYKDIGRILHLMLTDHEANFSNLYKNLFIKTLRFISFQLTTITVCFSPLILIFWVYAPAFHEYRNSKADFIAIYKNGQIPLTIEGNNFPPESKTISIPISEFSSEVIDINLSGKGNFFLNAKENNAIAADSFRGLLLASLGFNIVYVEKELLSNSQHPIILRPWCGDFNPFWPYLSDQEGFLFSGMAFFSLLVMFSKRRKKYRNRQEHKEGIPSISFLDYLLASIAAAAPGFFRWIGDKESKYFKADLEAVSIDRPIFVTGLARSGTTILLEMLSLKSVATHRYRDFPFVMTPILWQWLTNKISSTKPPRERPHKDGIYIDRESPDAFEEPIWQYFFPYTHLGGEIHLIQAGNGSKQFAAFFSDHIRKILLIRNGTRYVSKGNYNLTRIPYISSIFPDALFVIPVRHPVDHVRSLVRQNEIFHRYAQEDARISDLLRVAGHYEFGPQRVPICLRDGTHQRISESWRSGREYKGYAIQWAEIYRYVAELRKEKSCTDRIFIIRYEDLCERPVEFLTELINFCGIGCDIATAATRIKAGKVHLNDMNTDIYTEIWEETREIAELFGYEWNGSRDR